MIKNILFIGFFQPIFPNRKLNKTQHTIINISVKELKKRISYKGRGKTERPVCPLCGEDMKVSLEHVRGKSPKKYGHHCLKCKYQTFD